MDDRQDRHFAMTGSERFDPTFAIYESSFQQPFPGASGRPTHFDGIPFWYRPDLQDAVFDHHKLLYHQGIPVSNSSIEQPVSIKHRRTRSGCFTCRHRRVKCDETRPICERCKKGSRECQFPQPSSSSSRRVDATDSRNTQTKTSSQQGVREGISHTLPSIEDEGEEAREGSISPEPRPTPSRVSTPSVKSSKSSGMKNNYQIKDHRKNEIDDSSSTNSTSPPSHTGTHAALLRRSTKEFIQKQPSNWKHLSPTIQQHLQFHHQNITCCHYFLRFDSTDFIHNELIDAALSFEPLLYAVVGFAAYHETLSNPTGCFQNFWKFYCQSIMLLRKWLESHTDRNEAVLLTVLQLATFEEYMGDWASLAGHQRAAYSIFGSLYTYENFMSTPTSRCAFDWLARGDVVVSIAAGVTTTLDRRWFVTAVKWYQRHVDLKPTELVATASYLAAKIRLANFDIASIHASAASNKNMLKDIQGLTERMDKLRNDVQNLYLATHSMGKAGSEGPEDSRIQLFRGPYWSFNFLLVDYYATEQMHKYKTALYEQAAQRRTQSQLKAAQIVQSTLQASTLLNPPPELEKLSLILCQLLEAIEKYPEAPPGAFLSCQTSLALASVFLQRSPKYMIWARRKLAKTERLGYVWPPSFRKRMAQLWQDDRILEWWLPDDEYRISLLDEVREVVEERNRETESRGGDEWDDVRETRAVFDKLDFRKDTFRTRKDSLWSTSNTEGGGAERPNLSSPDESDDSDEDGSEDDDEDGQRPHRHQRGSKDGGNEATATTIQARHIPQTLEYSNRMSGIWEG